MNAQLEHALIIRNTTAYNVIAAQREQAHGDIVGDGELSLMIDDLVALLERIGAKSEEVCNRLRASVETSELPAVVIYDDEGHEVDSTERAS